MSKKKKIKVQPKSVVAPKVVAPKVDIQEVTTPEESLALKAQGYKVVEVRSAKKSGINSPAIPQTWVLKK